jgi:hypothetical protein
MRGWHDKEEAKVPKGSAQRANISIRYVINIDLYRSNPTDSKGVRHSTTENWLESVGYGGRDRNRLRSAQEDARCVATQHPVQGELALSRATELK